MGKLDDIKAIIFDFDGTLAVLNIDFSFMKEKVFELMENYGIAGEKVREKYLLEIIEEVYKILREKTPAGAEDFFQKAHQIIHDVELRGAERGSLIPGVDEMLDGLRDRGIKVGIVTRNCEEAVRKVFPSIDDHCDVFVSRDSTRNVKPHPDHLNSVLKRLEVSGNEAVMIGDHPIDIQAGLRVGMKTVGVLTGRIKREEFEKAGADYVLEDASKLYQLLD